MPQMAPINWLSIFIFFILLLLTLSSLNFFLFNYKLKSLLKKYKHSKNWKW